MKMVFISDTHSQHDVITLPEGEFLFHSGDFSKRGKFKEVTAFFDWFSAQPHKHKVFIAGNHDFLAERDPSVFEKLVPANIHYLNDSGIELEGIKIWGSPVQPWFYDWAFNRKRGADIQKHWDMIPADTDILITHGPPYGILDKVVPRGELVGCKNLLDSLSNRKIKIVAFGHIHEAYGWKKQKEVLYINASVLNEKYKHVNAPIVIDWPSLQVKND